MKNMEQPLIKRNNLLWNIFFVLIYRFLSIQSSIKMIRRVQISFNVIVTPPLKVGLKNQKRFFFYVQILNEIFFKVSQ